ncbi:MAG: glycosyltransferase family 2 protein [Cypionkella sp.]
MLSPTRARSARYCIIWRHIRTPDLPEASCTGRTAKPIAPLFSFPPSPASLKPRSVWGWSAASCTDQWWRRRCPSLTSRVDWLAGASLMMRQSVLDRIGLFDERFFLYFEETELCLRAARAGYTVDYVVESQVEHIGSVSTGMREWTRIPQFWLDSRLHYFTKSHGRAYAVAATVAHIAGGVFWRARLLVQRKDPGDPPRYLSDLTIHAMRRGVAALFRGPVAQTQTRPAE